MKHIQRIYFTCLLLILGTSPLFAQVEQPVNNENYFDDAGTYYQMNLLKTDLAALYSGLLTLHYERALGDVVAIEASIGTGLGWYNPGIEEWIKPEFQYITNPTKAFTYEIMPRLYYPSFWSYNSYEPMAPEGNYYGFRYRYRTYTQGGFEYTYKIISFVQGYQFLITEKIAMDLSVGLGFMGVESNAPGFTNDFGNTIEISIGILPGYFF